MPDDTEVLTAEEQAEFDSQRGQAVQTPPPAVEPTQEQQQSAPVEDARPKTVPHAALHEERESHKETKRALDDLNNRYARLEERTNILLQDRARPAEQPKEEPAAIPRLEDDPLAHLLGRLNHYERTIDALQNQGQQQQQHLTQAQQMQQVAMTARA